MTKTLQTGGRMSFEVASEVRLLEVDGTISSGIYIVEENRSDRSGQVALLQKGGNLKLKVNQRRVLPVSIDGKALVIESSDRYWAICPACGTAELVSPNTEVLNCNKCSVTFPLHWLGVKPMTTTTAPVKEKKTATKKAAAPRQPRERKVKTAIVVDFHALKKIGELYTKNGIKFDHAAIDVKSHVLLVVDGETGRKLCFNTYNGTLGKNGKPLPLDEFQADKIPDGKEKKPWFELKDITKARAVLDKTGFTKE